MGVALASGDIEATLDRAGEREGAAGKAADRRWRSRAAILAALMPEDEPRLPGPGRPEMFLLPPAQEIVRLPNGPGGEYRCRVRLGCRWVEYTEVQLPTSEDDDTAEWTPPRREDLFIRPTAKPVPPRWSADGD